VLASNSEQYELASNEKQDAIEKLRTMVDELKETEATAEATNLNLTLERNDYLKALEKARNDIRNYADQNLELEKENQELKMQNNNLDLNNKTILAAITSTNIESLDIKAINKRLNHVIEEMKEDMAKIKDENKGKDSQIQNISRRIEDCNNEIDQLKEKLKNKDNE